MNAEVKDLIQVIKSKFMARVYNVTLKKGVTLFEPLGRYEEFVKDVYAVLDAAGYKIRAANLVCGHVTREKTEEDIIRAIEDFVVILEQQKA
jgi:hypothetical protein